MYLENTQLESVQVDQEVLTKVLAKYGLECHGGWDYDRMTFDRKFDVREGRYYLRLFCNAVSGDVGAHNATLNIIKPVIGKYYYPHGVEYTDEVWNTNNEHRVLHGIEEYLQRVIKCIQVYAMTNYKRKQRKGT